MCEGQCHVCQYNDARIENFSSFYCIQHRLRIACPRHDGTRRARRRKKKLSDPKRGKWVCAAGGISSKAAAALFFLCFFSFIFTHIENSILLHIKLCDFFLGTKFAWGNRNASSSSSLYTSGWWKEKSGERKRGTTSRTRSYGEISLNVPSSAENLLKALSRFNPWILCLI